MSRMRRFLPGRADLLLFAVLAVLSAAIVHLVGRHDAGLSLAAFPIFVFAAVWGLWKNGRLKA